MEKYIIIFDDGGVFQIEKITEDAIESAINGDITLIRLSDTKILSSDGDWVDMLKLKINEK